MKRLITIFNVILSTSLPSQVDTTFSELRGLDDSFGATHLFYRKYSYQDFHPYWVRHNDVYHLDLAAQSDTLTPFQSSTYPQYRYQLMKVTNPSCKSSNSTKTIPIRLIRPLIWDIG